MIKHLLRKWFVREQRRTEPMVVLFYSNGTCETIQTHTDTNTLEVARMIRLYHTGDTLWLEETTPFTREDFQMLPGIFKPNHRNNHERPIPPT